MSKDDYVKMAARTTANHGCMAKRRWDSNKFDAGVDGAPAGVTKRQWQVIKVIQDAGDATKEEIAKAIGVSRHTIQKIVFRLHKIGLLKKQHLKRQEYVYSSVLEKRTDGDD